MSFQVSEKGQIYHEHRHMRGNTLQLTKHEMNIYEVTSKDGTVETGYICPRCHCIASKASLDLLIK